MVLLINFHFISFYLFILNLNFKFDVRASSCPGRRAVADLAVTPPCATGYGEPRPGPFGVCRLQVLVLCGKTAQPFAVLIREFRHQRCVADARREP